MRVLVLALIVGWLGLAATPAAADSKTTKARKHFKQGEAYRQAKAYDLAIAEYEAAYALVPRPGFLFNIGLVHEEAGDARAAADHYRRYLEVAPESDAAVGEARARLAALERVIASEDERLAHERRTAELAAVAAAHVAAGRDAEAAEAYRAVYAASGDAEYLFDEGEALRRTGNHKAALVAYERYRREAPGGARVGDAVEHVIELEQAIAAELHAAAQPVDPQPISIAPGPSPSERPRRAEGVSWIQVAIGAALLGGGLALDVIPESGKNGALDALDFVPAGLYAAGTIFVVKGVF